MGPGPGVSLGAEQQTGARLTATQRVLVIGATSRTAAALASELAAGGASLVLAARDEPEIGRLAADLRVRYGAEVFCSPFEATEFDGHGALVRSAAEHLGGLDLVIVAFGMLGDQGAAEHDFAETRRVIDVNYTAAASVLTHVADVMEKQRSGAILILTSVAGDRGRRSNYVYGSAKGAVTLFASGLRARLASSNVRVITAKLGFVDTKMTFGRPGMFLTAQPARVAAALHKDLRAGKDVVYVPRFWRWVMLAIKLTPERLFKRLPI